MATPPDLSKFPPGYLEEDTSHQVVAVAISFIVINTLATIFRAWARRIKKGKIMASDYLMPISLVFNIGVCICLLLGAKWGVGKHIAAVPLKDIIPFTYLVYYGMATTYIMAVTFSKLAILDLYLHIMIDTPSRYISYAMGFIIIASAISNFVAVMAQCRPFASAVLYNPKADGYCHNIHAHYTWASLPNIITDFVMMVLPIPLVLRIQQPWQVKLGIWITFLVGSLGIITAIIRLNQFYTYGWDKEDADPTWISTIIFTWTCVEPGVYHLAACSVTLRPLFAWIIFESPVSSILSRTRLISGRSSRGTNGTKGSHTTHRRIPESQLGIDLEQRNDLLNPGKGNSISAVTIENEQQSLDDLNDGGNIYVQRKIVVSGA